MNPFGFEGKQVVVVGGASGMGNAAARLAGELGGTVTILDVQPPLVEVGDYHHMDLRDPASIDGVLGQLGGPIHVLLSCAGVADGGTALMQVNFIGQRHLIERCLEQGLVPQGGAIATISSIGGLNWPDQLSKVLKFLDTPDFESATRWISEHQELAHYGFSKQAMNVYCARRAPALVQAGIRINCIAPGPTRTPLMDANPGWGAFDQAFEQAMGHPGATPEEQAYPLLFLASTAASHVSGTCLVVDLGFTEGGMVGAVESPLLAALLPNTAAAASTAGRDGAG